MKRSDLTPLKVLFLTHAYPDFPGSFRGHLVYRMARGLRERGVLVDVLTPRVYRASPLRETDDSGVRVHRFVYPSADRMLLHFRRIPVPRMIVFYLSAFLKARALLARRRYHLIHAHWIVPLGPLAVVLGLLTRTPVILHAHGSDVHTYAAGRTAVRRLACFALRHAARTVVVSRGLGRVLSDLCGVSENRFLHHPPFIDGNLFSPAGERPDDSTVIFVGGLNENKGILPLMEAAEAFLGMRPELRLMIVGEGPLRDRIEHWRKSRGLENRVTLTGAVDYGQVSRLLRQARVLVLPSFREGTPSVILEALACSVPCIASRTGDIPSIVRDGENGLLIEPGSARDLAAAVIRLCLEPELDRRLRANARLSVYPYLTRAGVDRLLETYVSILSP